MTKPVGSIHTVHNLAYQGVFPAANFAELGLPAVANGIDGMEFYGQISFMKAGLFYADRITTVSPTYAREIQTPDQGCGLDGLLRAHGNVLSGLLNAVDETVWNPAADPLIPAPFDAMQRTGKSKCKAALQREMGLAVEKRAPLFGVVSRLTEQKGLNLVVAAIDEIVTGGGQLVVLGSGDGSLELALREQAAKHPQSVAVTLGYDEALAHRIFAGTDVTLVPSRLEPCGLTQMYGLKYGSLPLVRRVGGLAGRGGGQLAARTSPKACANGSCVRCLHGGSVFARAAPRLHPVFAAKGMERAGRARHAAVVRLAAECREIPGALSADRRPRLIEGSPCSTW